MAFLFQAVAFLVQTHGLIAFLVQMHAPEIFLVKMLKDKAAQLWAFILESRKSHAFWFSKQNALINEVPTRSGTPLEWDKTQVWVKSACFYLFFAMLAGRVSKEGG